MNVKETIERMSINDFRKIWKLQFPKNLDCDNSRKTKIHWNLISDTPHTLKIKKPKVYLLLNVLNVEVILKFWLDYRINCDAVIFIIFSVVIELW